MIPLLVLLLVGAVVFFLLWIFASGKAAQYYADLDAETKLRRATEQAHHAAEQAFHATEQALAALQAKSADEKKGYEAERDAIFKRVQTAEDENRRLSKWQDVADADEKAAELMKRGEAMLHNAGISANTIVMTAEEQAKATMADAKQEAKRLKDEARTTLDSATQQAGTIVKTAEAKADEIAGSAYEAMQNAALYEQTVKAMKNVIEGYGERYMVPERSLLDDLADEFGFTQAGEELKKARERTNLMVRNGTAATCEYVEENRRTTAINFVIDAFNGKVDSIL